LKRAGSESKTKSGRRWFYLPVHVYHTLEARRAVQAARALQLGSLWRDHNLVFPPPTGEPPDMRFASGERPRALAGRAEVTERFTP
jgi:hypothetical protein